jgi:seryl-tRNA synthetase
VSTRFDKVEIVQLVHPEKSYDVLEEMVKSCRKIIKTHWNCLIAFLKLCGGDMSFASALTYDFEVYVLPRINGWK